MRAAELPFMLGKPRNNRISHISRIQRIGQDACVWLDAFTIRNLANRGFAPPGCPHVAGRTEPHPLAMGARLLRNWVLMPLRDRTAIEARPEVVEHLSHLDLCESLHNGSQHGRLGAPLRKVAGGRINPKELAHLGRALTCWRPSNRPALAAQWTGCPGRPLCLGGQSARIKPPEAQTLPCCSRCGRRPAASTPNAMAPRLGALEARTTWRQIQEREALLASRRLSAAYNNAFGYCLEVRNAHNDTVPEGWVRKQPLTQAERYITDGELKEYEAKILGGEEKILALAVRTLLSPLVQDVTGHLPRQSSKTRAPQPTWTAWWPARGQRPSVRWPTTTPAHA